MLVSWIASWNLVKFQYTMQLFSLLAAREPARELIADLVSDLSQTGSSYLDNVEIARTWSQTGSQLASWFASC